MVDVKEPKLTPSKEGTPRDGRGSIQVGVNASTAFTTSAFAMTMAS